MKLLNLVPVVSLVACLLTIGVAVEGAKGSSSNLHPTLVVGDVWFHAFDYEKLGVEYLKKNGVKISSKYRLSYHIYADNGQKTLDLSYHNVGVDRASYTVGFGKEVKPESFWKIELNPNLVKTNDSTVDWVMFGNQKLEPKEMIGKGMAFLKQHQVEVPPDYQTGFVVYLNSPRQSLEISYRYRNYQIWMVDFNRELEPVKFKKGVAIY